MILIIASAKHMRIASFLFVILALPACRQEPAKQPVVEVSGVNDFVIELGKKVGPITGTSTLTDLQAIYGSDKIVLRNIYIAEGEEQEGAVVFPESSNELEIGWDIPANTGHPAFVRISRIGGAWATTEGVKVQLSLDELQKLNGKPFKFYGFGWDYGGQVTDWNGGRFKPTLGVVLGPAVENLPEEFLGEVILNSDDPKVRALDLRIDAIILTFDK